MHRAHLARRNARRAVSLLALACTGPVREGAPPEAAEPAADRIFLGDVLTIDANGTVARAVAVKDGRVLLVGDEKTVLKHRGRETEVVDLAGGALLPGFIDPHSHLMAHGVPIMGWANVSRPPVGDVENIPRLLAVLDAHAKKIGMRRGSWIVAYGYDKEGLAEARELTRDDLDARFPNNPVAVIHVSSHGAVLNSAALRAVGISARDAHAGGRADPAQARQPGAGRADHGDGVLRGRGEASAAERRAGARGAARGAAPLRGERLHHDPGRRDQRRAARAVAARGGRGASVPRRGGAAGRAHVRRHRGQARGSRSAAPIRSTSSSAA